MSERVYDFDELLENFEGENFVKWFCNSGVVAPMIAEDCLFYHNGKAETRSNAIKRLRRFFGTWYFCVEVDDFKHEKDKGFFENSTITAVF